MDRVWTVDFWFDPSCPLSRNTARWLLEVSGRRPVSITWRVMSLSVLNEGRDDDPEGDPEGYLWIPARICAAVQHEHGHDALGRFYRALWSAVENGDGDWIGDFDEALAAADLPGELAAAGGSGDYDGVLRRSHDQGLSLVGEGAGTPITAVTSPDGAKAAFFGPVVEQVPTGAHAADLWDGALLVAGVPGFRELKARGT
ncbi:mycothiol-dependent nitroreductase Rv2466c family protein [Nocardiopsis baichengensis]|uniref:mycothiol-dependent nitroreductase Rv2466c family protein n=1 Tax=Nocardiopsis baichengensis TaxID=280240 RepID=UPI00034B1775|nr:hypothetical protein [Nocardiopsis baichengensis]